MPRQSRLDLGHLKRQGRVEKCRFRNQPPYLRPSKAAISREADPGVDAPELIDHSPGSQDGVFAMLFFRTVYKR